jgi:uncharacterized Zn finger protein
MSTSLDTQTDAFAVLRESRDLDMMALKRAYWEDFSFEETEGTGEIHVVNDSYGYKRDEHTHTLTIGGHIPCHCTCSSWKYRSSPCKHMVAAVLYYPHLDRLA